MPGLGNVPGPAQISAAPAAVKAGGEDYVLPPGRDLAAEETRLAAFLGARQ